MRSDSRVLLPLSYGFSVRYALPTGLVRGLAEVCRPVVGLGWEDPELTELLTGEGAEVVQLPAARLTHDYRMFRRRLALVHEQRLASVTTPIRRRRQRAMVESVPALLVGEARRVRDRMDLLRPGAGATWEAHESSQVEAGTNAAEFRDLLAARRVDAVLSLTPYHDQDALALWAARTTGRPTMTSLISFDNPTTRERWIVRSDEVMVWNHHNADELVRSYPDLDRRRVSVIGAPQFDLHHRPELVLPRDEWCRRLSVPEDRPVILYGAGPAHLVPGEAALVHLIDDAITAGSLPGAPFLVVRRHPVDPGGPWRDVGSRLRHGIVADPWAEGPDAYRSWPTHDDLVLQMSSLAHAEVHVNVCSSMTLDGAVFDRPQVGPTFVPGASRSTRRQVRDLYAQEHWLPIAASGGLDTADDGPQLIRAIRNGLQEPGARRAGRRRMVRELLTRDDGAATERLVAQVDRSLRRMPRT